jgi:ribonuclease D
MRLTVALHLYQNDLPDYLDLGPIVAVDCETMGLNPARDRLCLVQLSSGDGHAHLVQVAKGQTEAPNLVRMIKDENVLKLFHFGRFDIAAIENTFQALARPVYCTKIASKLVRTFTDRHGLKNLLQELLDIDISKHQQTSDWGAEKLSSAQLEYAASDVLYLHQLRDKLDDMLAREGRSALAQSCFDFLPTRAKLDLAGWPETDIFSH